nr:hypothetical protein [Tanacetum cinerariifolium]
RSCLRHHLQSLKLPSTPIMNQGGYFGEPAMSYQMETPPAPQDEDEHVPMFIQPHDPDFVPKPIYLEYIPLEDEHVLSTEEQPLPHIVSPTAESPEYVVELDPEEDPEEHEDDETEDGTVDYPMDGGDDRDDDDGDSSGDDADDEDEDDEDEEEEDEHLAPVDFAIVIPTDELVSPHEGTDPVMPPPSTDTTTTRARNTVRLQAAISFLPEAEVKRLLAMPTLPPSPLASLSPPSAGERLARCTDPTALPPSPLPPPLHMPPPVDRRDDIPETEMPPRKRLCFSTQGSRDTWVDPTETIPEIAPMTVGEQVDLLMEDMMAYQETIHIVKKEAYAAREAWVHSIGMSQAVHFELQTYQEQIQQAEKAELQETDRRRQAQMVKFATYTLLDAALTWWNSQIRSLGLDAYSMTWEVLKKKMTDKYCPQGEIKKLEIELWNLKVKENNVLAYTKRFQELTLICTKFVADETEKIDKYLSGLPDNIYGSVEASKPKTLDDTIELANEFLDQKLCTYAERQINNKRKADDSFKNNHGHQQQIPKMQNVARIYNIGTSEKKLYSGNLLKNNGANPKGNGCFECGALWHFKRDCPKFKNKDGGKVNAPGWVYAVGNASRDPDSNVVTGMFLLNNRYASILSDTGADRSFISIAFISLTDIIPTPLGNSYDVKLADGKIVGVDTIMRGYTLNFLNYPFNIDLMPVELGSFDVIIGMDWLRRCHAVIVYDEKLVRVPYGNETLIFRGEESNNGRESRLTVISCSKAQEYMEKGCQIFLAHISAKKEEDRSEGKQL